MAIPAQFAPTFPCFSVFDDTCKSPCFAAVSNQGKGLVVLTDEDLLDRYRRSNPEAIGPAIMIDSGPQMVLFLDSLPGVTHIAFDPTAAGTAFTVDRKTFYDAVVRLMRG